MTPWIDHVKLVKEAIQEKGYESVLDFLSDHKTVPYPDLIVELFGKKDWELEWAIKSLHKDESKAAGLFREACKDALIRFCREYLPFSWRRKNKDIEKRMGIHGSWIRFCEEKDNLSSLSKVVWDYLEYRVPPQYDWLPESEDDPIITELFDKFWPPDSPTFRLPPP